MEVDSENQESGTGLDALQYNMDVMNDETNDSKGFVGRVASFPVVASSIGTVMNMYSRCKESHDLVKYSFETAENGVKYVSGAVVAPVAAKLEKPLSSVDAMACSGLDIVEEKCPIITKPTEEVLAPAKNVYEGKIKPAYDTATQYAADKIIAAKDYGIGKVSDVTGYSTDQMAMVRDTSYEKLNMVRDKSCEAINAALATETGQTILNKVDSALTVAEDYVDHYLPEKQDEEKNVNENNSGVVVDEAVEQSKPVVIYDKARHRLYARAMSRLQDVQVRSKETLERLNFTVNLIEYAKSNLSAANERVSTTVQAAREKGYYWWDEICKEEGDAQLEKGSLEAQTMEMQVLGVARNLTQKLRQTIHSINETGIPENLRSRVVAAKQYSTELATSFLAVTKMDDLSDTVMTRAHEQAEYIQDTVSKMADVAVDSWPLNQVTPDDFMIDDLGQTDDETDGLDENDNVTDTE